MTREVFPAARPAVVLHIGEPKTGTTFLQQVMWGNRAELAAQGVVLPGHHAQDHYRASQDLRGIAKLATDPAGSWTGEWEILARQAQQAGKTAVISHELFSAADAEQAGRAVAALQPAEVHVVLTVRDIATLLPAEWQETVKHRNARGSSAGVLWERFASVLGIDPATADLTRARPNSSLGMPETEFLRRLNLALPQEVPDWFYMWNVKEAVAHRELAGRPSGGGRLVLPADRDAWAKEHAEALVAGLRDSGYDLIGDLGELLPGPAAGPAASPAEQPAGEVLDAAVRAAAALVVNQYRQEYPAARPQPEQPESAEPPGGRGGLAGLVESAVASSPRLKRAVRELSSRSPAVRRMRILAWQALERSRSRRRP
jgi:hypothetical protein